MTPFLKFFTDKTSSVTSSTISPIDTTTTEHSHPPPFQAGSLSSVSETVIIFLLVILIIALIVLSYKHRVTRAKLREYQVTQNGQNYDNPMFSGQHTSAERYGSYQSGT